MLGDSASFVKSGVGKFKGMQSWLKHPGWILYFFGGAVLAFSLAINAYQMHKRDKVQNVIAERLAAFCAREGRCGNVQSFSEKCVVGAYALSNSYSKYEGTEGHPLLKQKAGFDSDAYCTCLNTWAKRTVIPAGAFREFETTQ